MRVPALGNHDDGEHQNSTQDLESNGFGFNGRGTNGHAMNGRVTRIGELDDDSDNDMGPVDDEGDVKVKHVDV